jgi:hypothetical protein
MAIECMNDLIETLGPRQREFLVGYLRHQHDMLQSAIAGLASGFGIVSGQQQAILHDLPQAERSGPAGAKRV